MNTTKQVPDYGQIQDGVTWLGGTTHELQRQHIPGYQGHVKGLHAQNIYGKNFARVSAQCLNTRHTKGIDYGKEQKYVSSYKTEFDKPDQRKTKFAATAEEVLGKLDQTEKAINQAREEEYRRQPKSIEEVAPLDRMPIPGYMGHRAVFRPPMKEVKPPPEPQSIQLKEKIVLESMLKTGTLNQNGFQQVTRQQPVVGYAGFLKGVKAENQYGVSYKDLAKQSINS